MDDFDRKLSDALKIESRYDGASGKEMSSMAGGIFDRNIATAKAWTWAFLAFETVCMIVLFWAIFFVQDVKWVVVLAALLIMSYATTILMKLWFWIVHTRIKLQEDMRALQLQIAELNEKLGEKMSDK
jgi:membrane protein insertase Oxa1/YidC/SpoIIIJ